MAVMMRDMSCPDYFNPRTPVGCDAPFRPAKAVDAYFNPRTPVGCDVTLAILLPA